MGATEKEVLRNLSRLLDVYDDTRERNIDFFNGGGYSALAMRDKAPDTFFGPIGDMVARAIPGLSTRGISGDIVPILKTNFRFANSGESGWLNMVKNQNSAVHGAAQRAQKSAMDASWAKLFGDNSLIDRAIDAKGDDGKYVFNEASREKMHGVAGLLGSPMGAAFFQNMMNSAMGYDRGISSNIMNAASYNMTSGFSRYYGGRDVSGVHGRMVSRGPDGRLAMHLVDPFSRDYQDTRASIASLGTSAVQKAMYDGNLKKLNMHGASEALVSDIVANAIASGDIEDLMKGQPITAIGENGEEKTYENFGKLVEEHKNVIRDLDSADSMRAEAKEQLAEARKRGDSAAEKQIEARIKKYDDDIERLTKQADELAGVVEKAATPLIESVSGVISGLKDFYGTQEEAQRALDSLTGGRGLRDQRVAESVNRQLDEIKMLGMAAGIDPTVMGKHFTEIAFGFSEASGGKSKLSDGSDYNGQMSLSLENLFAKQLIAAAGDTDRQNRIMNAQAGYARSAGKSQGNDFMTLLMLAKKGGAFEGRESDFNRLVDMFKTGGTKNLENAWNQLGVIGFGSVQAMEELAADESFMSNERRKFSHEDNTFIGNTFAEAHANEVNRMLGESGNIAYEKRQRQALAEAGLYTSGIDKDVGAADFDAIVNELGDIGTLDEGTVVAQDALQRDYEQELARNGGDVNAAKAAVADRYHRTYAESFLTEKSRNRVADAGAKAREARLEEANYFTDSNGIAITLAGKDFMHSLGATDKEGGVTKTALSQAGTNLFDYAVFNGQSLRTKEGKLVDPSLVQRKRADFERLVRENKGEEAQNLLGDWLDTLSSTSQDQLILANNSDRKQYRTSDVIESEKKRDSYLNDVLRNRELASKMGGMSGDDSLVYAEEVPGLTAEVTEEQKEGAIKNMRDRAAAAEKESAGDLEKAVEAAQTGDLERFFEIFKNNDATMESFFDLIKRIVELGGGIVAPDSEIADANKFRKDKLAAGGDARVAELKRAREGSVRNDFLASSSMTMVERLGMGTSDEVKAYLEALRGGEVSDKDVSRYKRNSDVLRRTGNRSFYRKMLSAEDELLATSEKELRKKIKGAGSDEEKKKLEEQLAAVEKQRKTIAEHRAEKSRQNATEFMREAKGVRVVEKENAKETPSSGSAKSSSSEDISELVVALKELTVVLKDNNNTDPPRLP